eukprot:TRINITY_DN27967_c0_g1_i1.p2 TRINITY_DN27967_c0_g1~~TRINITY_DN27967_c0_g1_i1.p2  ORF type:complete len:114 (+),score=17.57 TRINITY_DN27967_c0_g1_i1:162-503(+)
MLGDTTDAESNCCSGSAGGWRKRVGSVAAKEVRVQLECTSLDPDADLLAEACCDAAGSKAVARCADPSLSDSGASDTESEVAKAYDREADSGSKGRLGESLDFDCAYPALGIE